MPAPVVHCICVYRAMLMPHIRSSYVWICPESPCPVTQLQLGQIFHSANWVCEICAKMKHSLSPIVIHVSLSKAVRPAEWANLLSLHSMSVPRSESLLLLQMGQRPRGLHYKQQIKGLPLIRCQGQRGALPVLAMIQYLLICLHSWIKRNQSIDRKNRKKRDGEMGRIENKNKEVNQWVEGTEIGGGMKEVKANMLSVHLNVYWAFSYAKKSRWG